MTNEEVQQKMWTESNTTIEENINFAFAYEEGAIRQQSFEKSEKPKIKTDSNEVNNISKEKKRWGPVKKCFRCGGQFENQLLKECKAIGITYMKFGKKGHFAKCCQTKGSNNSKSRKVARPHYKYSELMSGKKPVNNLYREENFVSPWKEMKMGNST